MTDAILHGMVPASLDKRQRAHIAYAIPGDPSRWPEGERKYLCGRKAAELHSRTFPWKTSDTFPTCQRCRKAAVAILEPKPKPSLTPRQEEALEWLPTVGKASLATLRRHGFQRRTFDTLASKGLVDRSYTSTPAHPVPVYRPLEKPYKVVFFGMLGYKIMAEFALEETARQELEWYKDKCRQQQSFEVKGYTRNASEHDFDVRTQDDLDSLTRAIQDSNRYADELRSG